MTDELIADLDAAANPNHGREPIGQVVIQKRNLLLALIAVHAASYFEGVTDSLEINGLFRSAIGLLGPPMPQNVGRLGIELQQLGEEQVGLLAQCQELGV